jgi:GDP-mannose 6-dehydrogenase
MEIFCHDKKLNISKVYLNPGFAFGGSCLPKDLRAFAEHANRNEIELPVIQSILQSNQSHMMSFLRRIEALNPLSVGIYGLSFKAGTDDLRESPSVQLVELLLENGYVVKIFDEMVVEAELLGQNKAHINERLPKFSELMVENVDMLCDTDLILLTHPINPSRITRWRELGKTVLDLTNTPEKEVASNFQIYC